MLFLLKISAPTLHNFIRKFPKIYNLFFVITLTSLSGRRKCTSFANVIQYSTVLCKVEVCAKLPVGSSKALTHVRDTSECKNLSVISAWILMQA